MDYTNLKFDVRDGIGILTMNRPTALNALNQEVFAELSSLLEEIESQSRIRVLVIIGEGKAFVAGADIKELQAMSPEEAYDFAELGKRVFSRLSLLKIPVIAAINGFALGGGLELALSCDIRIASENARLGLPEATLGLIPGFNGTQRLPRLIGMGHALYLMMIGEGVSAREAYDLGLVQKVCSPDMVMEEALILAQKIAGKGPNALRLIKEVARKGMEMPLKEGGKMESKEFSRLFKETNAERREGIEAFIGKRKPNW